ncbi:MAG: chemotaxis protein CheB, partial [Bacteroidota bacterium]|nr:chemotaxis protein CheB [Bacteroidota bacterium]
MKRKKYLKKSTNRRFDAIVIGVSAGGINALTKLLSAFPATYCLPIFIVQHISPKSDNYLVDILSK